MEQLCLVAHEASLSTFNKTTVQTRESICLHWPVSSIWPSPKFFEEETDETEDFGFASGAGSGSDDSDSDRIWVDRFDARLLLDSDPLVSPTYRRNTTRSPKHIDRCLPFGFSDVESSDDDVDVDENVHIDDHDDDDNDSFTYSESSANNSGTSSSNNNSNNNNRSQGNLKSTHKRRAPKRRRYNGSQHYNPSSSQRSLSTSPSAQTQPQLQPQSQSQTSATPGFLGRGGGPKRSMSSSSSSSSNSTSTSTLSRRTARTPTPPTKESLEAQQVQRLQSLEKQDLLQDPRTTTLISSNEDGSTCTEPPQEVRLKMAKLHTLLLDAKDADALQLKIIANHGADATFAAFLPRRALYWSYWQDVRSGKVRLDPKGNIITTCSSHTTIPSIPSLSPPSLGSGNSSSTQSSSVINTSSSSSSSSTSSNGISAVASESNILLVDYPDSEGSD